jgi:hypothetical protein
MSEAQPPIDVAAILAEIRDQVRREQALQPADAPLAPALSDVDLRKLLAEVEATRVVSVHWPLEGQTFVQRIMAMVNRVVRLHGLVTTIEEQQAVIAHLRARVTQLEQGK